MMKLVKTDQEVHNTITNHFLTMPRAAVNDTSTCYYRSDTGVKCFAGALIPDEAYSVDMERTTCSNGMVAEILREEGYDPDIIRKYQRIHDDASSVAMDSSSDRRTSSSGIYVNHSWPDDPDSEEYARTAKEWRASVASGLIAYGEDHELSNNPILKTIAGE